MPPFGAPASVEIYPAFESALLKIDKHSHFWILAWLMARPEREVLQVVPRGVSPDSPDPLHGVFAVRAPARPNPIGLTAARLTSRDGLTLHFDCLDFLDGTPVIDIKPYFTARDMIFSAGNAAVGRPRDREALRDSLCRQAMNFGCPRNGETALAIRIFEHFRLDVMNWAEPRSWNITSPLGRLGLADACIGLARVAPGRGLSFSSGTALEINGRARYELCEATGSFEATLAAAESALFRPVC